VSFTGTPLQNNLVELWALLSFLNPIFTDKTPFESAFTLGGKSTQHTPASPSLVAPSAPPAPLRVLQAVGMPERWVGVWLCWGLVVRSVACFCFEAGKMTVLTGDCAQTHSCAQRRHASDGRLLLPAAALLSAPREA
jgi:hypothetical protein